MASTAEIAKRYFAALSAHDLDAATACWRPGAIDRLVGSEDLVAPGGVRTHFSELLDEVAGFRMIELPGHAPGLIGLFRESDRLALVSDVVDTLDIQTGRKGGPRIPHPAFDADTEQARASIRKLAELGPSVVWAGHADPVSGDVAGQLRQAAAAPL